MKCPGQDIRYWSGKDIFETKCPKCGTPLEFFKDDSSRLCPQCCYRMLNPHINFGCAEYCPHAEQCLGSLPEGLQPQKGPKSSLKERVMAAMAAYFGDDQRRINHAKKVADYAEQINKYEQGDPAVIMACGYLHDIGIPEAERRHHSSAPRYQHQEGPPVARKILTELGVEEEMIAEICDIIGHHHQPRKDETTNFKVLYDADLLVNLQEQQPEGGRSVEKLTTIMNRSFLTEAGQRLAREILQID
ncbi:MAG: HD domain-containing protein [Deltaproteobacteria bacterium]|jgi:putative nucleotidyltransferase with HDIG domain|nr:HD domain-containing protein [Deltaproteobacteria bacterium]